MIITYRDELGYVSEQINPEYTIEFFEGFAYFTNAHGEDRRIPISNIEHIDASGLQ